MSFALAATPAISDAASRQRPRNLDAVVIVMAQTCLRRLNRFVIFHHLQEVPAGQVRTQAPADSANRRAIIAGIQAELFCCDR
jgi:hypothetical protein